MNEILIYPPELLTKKLVAYMLSTSESGVIDLVKQKKLIPVDDGGKWLKFKLQDVRDYVKTLPEWHRSQ